MSCDRQASKYIHHIIIRRRWVRRSETIIVRRYIICHKSSLRVCEERIERSEREREKEREREREKRARRERERERERDAHICISSES